MDGAVGGRDHPGSARGCPGFGRAFGRGRCRAGAVSHARIAAAGGKVLAKTDTWVEFAGLDATEDATLIDDIPADTKKTVPENPTREWERKIMDYDLSCTTPLDALNFLAGIQKELKNK